MISSFPSCILLHYFIDVICVIGMPCCTPYIGVFPKCSRLVVGSIHTLIALGPISFMEIGTLVTNGTRKDDHISHAYFEIASLILPDFQVASQPVFSSTFDIPNKTERKKKWDCFSPLSDF